MTSIGELIDTLHQLKTEKIQLEVVVKEKQAEINAAERDLMEAMDEQGVTQAAGQFSSVTIRESVKPQVVDWNEFYQFIYENEYGHLLDKRPSALGCAELFQNGTTIPGVVPRTYRKMALRAK